MPRYLVQRTFAQGLAIQATAEGAARCREIVDHNAELGVTWCHSYVPVDDSLSYCTRRTRQPSARGRGRRGTYEAPSPDAVRRAADLSGLPVDRVTEVRVLDPFLHR